MAQILIQSGDTLGALAQRNKTTVNALIEANRNNPAALPDPNNPDLILAGANLNLPQATVSFQPEVNQPLVSGDITPQAEIPVVSPEPLPPRVEPITEPKPILTPAEQKVQTATEKVQALNLERLGQVEFEAEQRREAGISGLQEIQEDLGSQLDFLREQALGIPEGTTTIGAKESGVSTAGLRSLQLNDLRRNRIETLVVSAHLSAIDRKIGRAEREIEQAIFEKFGGIFEEIEVRRENLKLLKESPEITVSERKRIEEREAEEDRLEAEVRAKEDEQREIWKISTGVAGIAPPDVLRQIQNVQTKEIALQLAAPFIKKEVTGVAGFTTVQRQKLEQAGLLNADRQTQLDFLFGIEDGEIPQTFEEVLAEAQEAAQQTFTPERVEELRRAYDAEIAGLGEGGGGLDFEDL